MRVSIWRQLNRKEMSAQTCDETQSKHALRRGRLELASHQCLLASVGLNSIGGRRIDSGVGRLLLF